MTTLGAALSPRSAAAASKSASSAPFSAAATKAGLPAALLDGWLNKVGGSVKTWKKRYFRLYADSICYYEGEGASAAKGSITLAGAQLTVYSADIFPQYPFSFGLTPLSSPRHYVFAADSADARLTWLRTLKPLCQRVVKQRETSWKEGYLTKQGGKIKTWKKRWVVLNDREMRYYKDVAQAQLDKDKQQAKAATSGGKSSKAADDGIDALDLTGGFEYESEKAVKDGEWVFSVKPAVGSGRVYRFACTTEGEREGWVKVLRQIKEANDSRQINVTF